MIAANPSGRRQVAVWAALFLVANMGVKAGYAGFMLLLATLLVPEDYANYGLLYSAQVAATTLATMGLVEVTAGRLRDYTSETRSQLFQNMTGLFLITAVTGCVLLTPIVLWLGGRNLGLAAIPAILLGVATGFSVLQASFHRIDERHAISLLSSAGVPLAAIIGIFVGAVISGNLYVMFGLGLLGACGVIATIAATGQAYGITVPSADTIRRTAIEVAPFLAIGFFGWASGYGMTLVVDWQFEPIDVARYTLLYTAASIGQVVASSMNMVWAPRFYRLFNNGEMDRAERQGGKFYALMALVLGLTGFMTAAAFPWLVSLIGGNLAGYGKLRLELMLLLAAYVLATPFWHCQNFYLVAGHGRELMHNSLWSGGVGLAVWIGCMFLLGPKGAYLGFLIQMAIKSVALWGGARHLWPVRPWWWAMVLVGGLLPFTALFMPVP
jgi:O-antigen/teichoic acid export membrane protein